MEAAAAPAPEFELSRVRVRLIRASERVEWDTQMRAHHYLGLTAMVGRSLRYVAEVDGRWLALLGWASPALKCASRDGWIGWSPTLQWQRLALIANNSRFLILPDWHHPNVGSRVLCLMQRRLVADWQARFGHPLLVLETFVDPRRFHGGVYRASNWTQLGMTQGYRRTREGYSADACAPKLVFVYPLCHNPQALLTQADRAQLQLKGKPNIMLTADQMRILPDFFNDIPDPRLRQGRRHRLSVVLMALPQAQPCVA